MAISRAAALHSEWMGLLVGLFQDVRHRRIDADAQSADPRAPRRQPVSSAARAKVVRVVPRLLPRLLRLVKPLPRDTCTGRWWRCAVVSFFPFVCLGGSITRFNDASPQQQHFFFFFFFFIWIQPNWNEMKRIQFDRHRFTFHYIDISFSPESESRSESNRVKLIRTDQIFNRSVFLLNQSLSSQSDWTEMGRLHVTTTITLFYSSILNVHHRMEPNR